VARSDRPSTDTQQPAGDPATAEADGDAAGEQGADTPCEQNPAGPPGEPPAGPAETDDAWLPL
jgi:hypothetical protein